MKHLHSFLLAFTILVSPIWLHGQIIVDRGIWLLDDSLKSVFLVRDINGLVATLSHPYQLNPYLHKPFLPETAVLMDEVKGLNQRIKGKDTVNYQCHLINCVALDSAEILIQLSYSAKQNDSLLLRADLTLMCKIIHDTFRFYTPLIRNTDNWKKVNTNRGTYHARTKPYKKDIRTYEHYLNLYDRKLGIQPIPLQFYICRDLPEALQLMGLNYKSDFNGYRSSVLSATTLNHYVLVDGSNTKNSFDPHDLWHSRLRKAIPSDSINRWVDEGCAYQYGGSWGLSLKTIHLEFLKIYGQATDTNWLDLYQKNPVFGNSKKPLYVAYLINSLIVQKLEKEKGFSPVLELLQCGRYKKDNTAYFERLQKVTGITKDNFNLQITQLVDQLKKS